MNKRQELRHWYIEEYRNECGSCQLAWGNVFGSDRFATGANIHTSKIRDICVNEDTQELVVITKRSVYYLPMKYCDLSRQKREIKYFSDELYEKIKLIAGANMSKIECEKNIEPEEGWLSLGNH